MTESKKEPAGDKTISQKESNKIREIDGPKGPEPTRYGDWELKGKAVDF